MLEYQTGIQSLVYKSIKRSKDLGLLYITKQQIIEDVSKVIELRNPSTQVSQALYQLQHNKKFLGPRIKHVDGGWTIINDSEIPKVKAYDELYNIAHRVLNDSG